MALIESNGEPIRLLNLETKLVSPEKVKIHEVNPRQGDVGALCVSFRENGFYGSVIVDKRDGRVLAGNHRVMAARQLGMRQIPVQYVDTGGGDLESIKILLADNRHSDLATYNNDLLADLLKKMASTDSLPGTGYDGDDLDSLLASLQDDEIAITSEGIERDESLFWDFVATAEKDEYDIPVLDPGMQGEIRTPYEVWGEHSRAMSSADTLFFYTDDAKFSSVKGWVPHIATKYNTVVEPNFSTDETLPYPVVLYDIFEKRAISAWLQALGCRVVVDVNVSQEFMDIALMGVPREWRSWCVRSHRGDDHDTYTWFLDQINTYTGSTDNVLCLYGGGEKGRLWAESNNQPWVPEKIDVANRVYPKSVHNQR